MPGNVQSAVLEILKGIQSDVSDVKSRLGRVENELTTVKTELAAVKTEVAVVKQPTLRQRRDCAATLAMMRGTVGVFDERMRQVEQDVRC